MKALTVLQFDLNAQVNLGQAKYLFGKFRSQGGQGIGGYGALLRLYGDMGFTEGTGEFAQRLAVVTGKPSFAPLREREPEPALREDGAGFDGGPDLLYIAWAFGSVAQVQDQSRMIAISGRGFVKPNGQFGTSGIASPNGGQKAVKEGAKPDFEQGIRDGGQEMLGHEYLLREIFLGSGIVFLQYSRC